MNRQTWIEDGMRNAKKRGAKHVTPQTMVDALEKTKTWIRAQMAGRHCAMTLEGVSVICGERGAGLDRPSYRLQVALAEMVEAGELRLKHMPDGDDRYYVPDGPSDPAYYAQLEGQQI